MDKGVPDLPYVLRPRGLRAGLTALLSVAAVFVVPAAAQAACQSTSTTKAFQAFGDSNDYSLVPNGGFELGAGGWSLTGARVTAGNESWSVRGANDSRSLAIDAGGTAVSPTVCVDLSRPTMRFFARRTSGSWGVLNVRVRWQDQSGRTNETTVSSLDLGTGWNAAPALNIARLLPLWNDDQDYSVQFVFDPENYGGSWAIDDVYVDPYGRG
ncbi:MAG TPA: hypothetical protein VLK59_11885 [Solirubrobacteraceae bacterium]|jgi:hypothetical protein|nr:hypothetical protein [Solirubrobacteraceae bacterium]